MEALSIEGQTQGQLAIGDSGVETSAMKAGIYQINSPADVMVKVSKTTASDVTASTGMVLLKGNTELIMVNEGSKIGVVGATSGLTGSFRYHWVGRLG